MPDERKNDPPERPRGAKPGQAGEKRVISAAGTPDVLGTERERTVSPNEAAAFDADQLDASIRAREKEDRGEVF